MILKLKDYDKIYSAISEVLALVGITEPVNNFWTPGAGNYCSFLPSAKASAGGLIQAARGKAGGDESPLTNRSG